MTGTIKTLVYERGFGFITAEDGKEYFFHRGAVDPGFDAVSQGDHVEFEPEPVAPRGPRAKTVKRVAAGSPTGASS